MAKSVLLEQFHLSILVASNLPEKRIRSARRTLGSRRFKTQLRSAVRRLFGHYPALRELRLSIDH